MSSEPWAGLPPDRSELSIATSVVIAVSQLRLEMLAAICADPEHAACHCSIDKNRPDQAVSDGRRPFLRPGSVIGA